MVKNNQMVASECPQDAIHTITEQVAACRQRYGKYVQLLIPWPVLMCRLGVGASVEEMLEEGPRPCSRRHGCFVDAMGCVFEETDGQLVECERKREGMVGRVYCGFPYREDEEFKLWCLLDVFEVFVGEKAREWKIEPLDGDHENTRVDNLLIKVEPEGRVITNTTPSQCCGIVLP